MKQILHYNSSVNHEENSIRIHDMVNRCIINITGSIRTVQCPVSSVVLDTVFTVKMHMTTEYFVLPPNWCSCVIRYISRNSSRLISNIFDEVVKKEIGL